MKSGAKGQGGRPFFGWMVVGLCLVIGIAFFGITYSFGVFFTSIQSEFGLSRASTSGIFGAYMMLGAVFAIVGGWALDRYGPRSVLATMGVITGVSLFLTGRVEHIWQLYITYSLLLAAGTGATYNVIMSTGSRWFMRRRATALAVIGTGAGLGTIIMAPVAAHLIDTYDWRTCFTVLGVVVWVVVLPSSLFLKKEPADIGSQPDGLAADDHDVEAAGGNSPAQQYSLARALRTQTFWHFFLIWFSYSFCLHLVITHVVPRAQDLGISPVRAAAIVSLIGALSVASRVVVGMMADRLGRTRVGVVCALGHTAAMLWLISSDQMWMFYVFAVVYGIAYGGIDPPVVALIGDHFGLRWVGLIMGCLIVGWGLGAAVGPVVGGLIYDGGGSYSYAFLAGALVMVAAALLINRLRPHG
jgi:MFS family permease